MNIRLKKEIDSFKLLWKDGYRTASSKKRRKNKIKDFMNSAFDFKRLRVLQIGSGGGYWSSWFSSKVKQLICVNFVSAEHSRFWEFMGANYKNCEKIKYYQVDNFDLNITADDSIDFIFSYDVFCYISGNGIVSFLNAIYKKLRPGGRALIMYADVKKYFASEPENIYIQQKVYNETNLERLQQIMLDEAYAGPLRVLGIWFWIGVQSFVANAERIGFEILSPDLNLDLTNPMTILFKPIEHHYFINNRAEEQLYTNYSVMPALADFVFEPSSDPNFRQYKPTKQPLNFKSIESGQYVFVKTDDLYTFFETIYMSIREPFVLIVGVSDLNVDAKCVFSLDVNFLILQLIACNCITENISNRLVKKTRKFLIGLQEPSRRPHDYLNVLRLLMSKAEPWEIRLKCCIPFHKNTHVSRNKLSNMLKSFTHLPKLDHYEYLSELGKFKFTLCNRGNGIDTHRFSETILMGSIPIVLSSPLDDLYSQFPCLIVSELANIACAMQGFTWDKTKYLKFLSYFWLEENHSLGAPAQM